MLAENWFRKNAGWRPFGIQSTQSYQLSLGLMLKIHSYFQNINMFTKRKTLGYYNQNKGSIAWYISVFFLLFVLCVSVFFNLTGVLKASEVSWQEEAQTNLSTLREQAKFLDQEEVRIQKEKQSNRFKRECYSKKLVSETPHEFLCEESFK